MKSKMTKKEVTNFYKNRIVIPYCAAQDLLWLIEPIGYTSGIYGWNADIYSVAYQTVIVTGYRPFGNIRPSYDLIQKYENKARAYKHGAWTRPYEEISTRMQEIRTEFLKELNII